MASTAWRSLLNKNGIFKLLKESKEKPLNSSESANILDVQDGTLFVWDASQRCILAVNLKYMEQTDETSYQILLPTHPPNHEINNLLFNSSRQLVALSGRQGISILKMPSRWGPFSLFEGGKISVICRTVALAERFFVCVNRVEVVQIAWHPGSKTCCHLVYLTSDNHLRIHDVSHPQKPEKLYSLGPNPSFSLLPSKPSFLRCLGETAVSFDFGEAITPKGSEEVVWPLYILRGNGDVYTLHTTTTNTPLLFPYPMKIQWQLGRLGREPVCYFTAETWLTWDIRSSPKKLSSQGPLSMHPSADDNYGADACSILYLNSIPPVLVIATCSGTLYHCVLLNREEDDEDHHTLGSDGEWLNSALPPQLSLYVYETVELELQLKTVAIDTGELEENCFMSSIRLYTDPITVTRYHCSHAAGVHTVAVPMIAQLKSLVNKEDDVVESILSHLYEHQSIVEHLICTKPLASSPPAPIYGLALVKDIKLNCIVLCLTSEFEILTIELVGFFLHPAPDLVVDQEARFPPSPLRQFASEPFDLQIKKILRRSLSNPILKSNSSARISPQEGFQLIARSTQVLREEYIQKQDNARMEIDRRVKSLHGLKEQQIQDIATTQNLNEDLRNKAQELAERYDEVMDRQNNMAERVENILTRIQRRAPVMSDAEQRSHKELLAIKNSLDFYRISIEQIKTKVQYQKQEFDAHNVTVNEQDSMSHSLNDIRRHQLYDILNNETTELTNLTRKINNLKKDLGI